MSDLTYAAELNEDNVVVRLIVGTAEWAVEHLGGVWVDPPELVGIGWVDHHGDIVPPDADHEPEALD